LKGLGLALRSASQVSMATSSSANALEDAVADLHVQACMDVSHAAVKSDFQAAGQHLIARMLL
jgi:hypothetical protein